MASSFTTNKSLEKPANGDYVDTWNVPVNGDMDIIDQAFGGTTALNATGGSATLTSTQYRSLSLSVTGAITGNVTYTIPAGVGGAWVVRNATTGSFDVIFTVSGSATPVTLLRNKLNYIYSDGTDIRSITNQVVDVAQGGTGSSSLTANNVLLGNGTSALQTVAPGSSGNVLTSNGTTWVSQAVGSVTAVNTISFGSTGFTPSTATSGAVTVAGTLNIANGGTGATSASQARTSLNAAKDGANSDITSLSGLTTPLSVSQGGTGLSATPTNGQLDIGNGTGFTRAALTAGGGISVTNGSGSITIGNSGVTSLAAGSGITVSGATGGVTVTNAGVTSLTGGTAISVSGSTGGITINNTGVTSATAGTGIGVSGSTGGVIFTNTGVTGLSAGTGISVSGSTGSVSVTNTGVTSLTAGNGITISGSTGGVTVSQDIYTGTTATNTSYPIGTTVILSGGSGTDYNNNQAVTLYAGSSGFLDINVGNTLTGTWRKRGGAVTSFTIVGCPSTTYTINYQLFQRVA